MAQYSEVWTLPLDWNCWYCSKSGMHGVIQASSHSLFPMGSCSEILNICSFSVDVQHEQNTALCHIFCCRWCHFSFYRTIQTLSKLSRYPSLHLLCPGSLQSFMCRIPRSQRNFVVFANILLSSYVTSFCLLSLLLSRFILNFALVSFQSHQTSS